MVTAEVLRQVRNTHWLYYRVAESELEETKGEQTFYWLLRRATNLPDGVESLWQTSMDRLYNDETVDVTKDGELLTRLNRLGIEIFCLLSRMARRELPPSAQRQAAISECETALNRLKRLKEQIALEWPSIDMAQIAESRAAFERGQEIPLEDFVRELQGEDKPWN